MKLTKRKGFNFFRSYFDVYNELDNNKDKVNEYAQALFYLGVTAESVNKAQRKALNLE